MPFITGLYSVSPELIRRNVELRIDRRNREAEIFYEGNSLRRFRLLPDGARDSLFLEEDRKAVLERWKRDRKARETRYAMNHLAPLSEKLDALGMGVIAASLESFLGSPERDEESLWGKPISCLPLGVMRV